MTLGEMALGEMTISPVNMINEKILVYQQNDTKTVFDSLFKLYEWDPDFVYSVCKSSLHFCKGAL